MINIIGYIAATLTTVSFLPQAIKTIKTRNTDGISFAMYTIFTVGAGFWLVYGILLKNPIIITSNTITLVLTMIILFIKLENYKKL